MGQDSKIRKHGSQPGSANSNWKGGRVVASNGYVLVRVGKDHPLADTRGYVYEHRLVAERVVGRPLSRTEIVHHKNGVKTDNRPENLEVVSGIAEHLALHRGEDSELRHPGEANPQVNCACGCGATFFRYDSGGRPREYVSGHNPVPAPRADAILAHLAAGPKTAPELASLMGVNRRAVNTALSKLSREGRVARVRRGVYSGKAA